jgi:hypothetical protein
MNKEEMVALINEMVLAYREDNTVVLEKRLRDLKYYFDDDTINYITELNASWKTDNDYIVISINSSNNIVQISNMIASCNINNIIVISPISKP